MSKKDSNLDKLAMKPGEYPVGKPFHYCPTNDCGECHGCITGKELGALVRPDLNDEEFEAHLEATFLDEGQLRVAGGLNLMDKNGHPTCFNGYCGKCSECYRKLRESVNQSADESLFKPGLISRRPLPLIGFPAGLNWDRLQNPVNGGFKRGEVSMISAGCLNPFDRFKSNWLANCVSDFVARGPAHVDWRLPELFDEPEFTGNDYYERLRNLFNSTSPVHAVWAAGGTRPEKIVRYIGSADHSFIPPNVRNLPQFVDTSPVIEVKSWGIWVGGKKILTAPFAMRDMIIDSITERYQMRGRYGAYGQFDARDCVYVYSRIAVGREDWAEDAIDKLVYFQLNGHHYGTNRHGDLIIPGRLTILGLQTARDHKMQARERLRQVGNPTKEKRGY